MDKTKESTARPVKKNGYSHAKMDARIDQRVAIAVADFKEEAKVVQGSFDRAMIQLEAVIRAMPRPEVTVTPEINLELPTRRTTKTISYDDQGRPSTITEEG